MKRLFLMLVAALALVACDKGGDDTPKPIELTGDTETAQTIYADETSKTEGIKFTATADWTAQVSEVTTKADNNDGKKMWLRLSAYEGKAGDMTLGFEIDTNDTGKDRKAEIRIACGGTTITIIVEQKATTQSGEKPNADKLIMKIEKIDDRTDGIRGSQLTEFFYDELNRVNKIVMTETEIEGVGSAEKTTTWISTGVITYAANTVSYNFSQTENGVTDKDGEGKGEITLDSNGRAISGKGSYIEEKSQIHETTSFTYSLEYNSDGCLVKSETIDSDWPDAMVHKLTWTNGNLTEAWWGRATNDNIDKAIYGSVPNKANLDLNWFYETGLPETEGFAFACGDSQNIFSILGYMGKRAENLVEQLSDGYNGKTDFNTKNSYTVDADGYPIMIEQSRKRYFGGQNNQSFEWEKGEAYKIIYNK